MVLLGGRHHTHDLLLWDIYTKNYSYFRVSTPFKLLCDVIIACLQLIRLHVLLEISHSYVQWTLNLQGLSGKGNIARLTSLELSPHKYMFSYYFIKCLLTLLAGRYQSIGTQSCDDLNIMILMFNAII